MEWGKNPNNLDSSGIIKLMKRSSFLIGRGVVPILLMLAGTVLIGVAIAMIMIQVGTGAYATPAKIGQTLNDFNLSDLYGNRVKLSDYRGKTVLVNVWATWCPPCQAEMPDLQAYYDAHRAQGFVILAIDAGDAQSDVLAFAKEYNLTFPILLDPTLQWVHSMNIYDYPTSLIIDSQGIVRNVRVGGYTPETLRADLNAFLSP
jgi:peroxiredoxin